jgi:hypothetical protein
MPTIASSARQPAGAALKSAGRWPHEPYRHINKRASPPDSMIKSLAAFFFSR